MAKSATITPVKTPRGELQWVTISGEGKENMSGKLQYVASIAFDPKDPAWAALIKQVEEFWETNRPKSIKKAKSNGFYPETRKTGETDENGKAITEPTGRMMLQFKTSTAWPDGKPTVVKVYNAKGNQVFLGDKRIGNGSLGEIAGSYDIYTNTLPKSGQVVDAGVTFYLNAIKISKFLEYSNDAGFDADDDEDGWTGDDDNWEGEATPAAEPAKAGPRL